MSNHAPQIEASAAQKPLFIGVDIGGTGIKIGLVDSLGRTIQTDQIATDAKAGYQLAMQRTKFAIDELLKSAGVKQSDVARIGLGIAGIINLREGRLINAANMPSWNNVLIRDDLSAITGLPVTFANDANAGAYGEFWIGAGREHESLALITLGTGVGAGIVFHGKPLSGAHDFGGEFGHIIIDASPQAWVCGCGQSGHLEAYCGTQGVTRLTIEKLKQGRKSSLAALLAENKNFTPYDVYKAAKSGDELAKEVIAESARLLAIGITSMLHLVDPDIVLIGGAMTFGGDDDEIGIFFMNAIRQEVKRRILSVLTNDFEIEYATLGSAAGYIGAAGLARQDFLNETSNKKTHTGKVNV